MLCGSVAPRFPESLPFDVMPGWCPMNTFYGSGELDLYPCLVCPYLFPQLHTGGHSVYHVYCVDSGRKTKYLVKESDERVGVKCVENYKLYLIIMADIHCVCTLCQALCSAFSMLYLLILTTRHKVDATGTPLYR